MATAPSSSVLNRPTQMFIGGKWVDAVAGGTLEVTNPADESTLAEVAYGGRADADRAVAAAAKAFPAWSKTTAYERAKILKKTADLIRERVDAIARTLTEEQGKPLLEAKGEVNHTADTFEWFAEEAKRVYGRIIPPTVATKRHHVIKHPVGVVGTITPWNFPAAMVSRKIAPALAAGCTVVSRPADQTPLTMIQLFAAMADAGVPEGVVNLVMGDAVEFADALFRTPRRPQDQLHRLDPGRQGIDPALGRSGDAALARTRRSCPPDRLPRRRRRSRWLRRRSWASSATTARSASPHRGFTFTSRSARSSPKPPSN